MAFARTSTIMSCGERSTFILIRRAPSIPCLYQPVPITCNRLMV